MILFFLLFTSDTSIKIFLKSSFREAQPDLNSEPQLGLGLLVRGGVKA